MKKAILIAAAIAAFIMLPFLCMTAYAAPVDEQEETVVEVDGPEDTFFPGEPPAPDEIMDGILSELLPIVNGLPVTDYPENPPRPFSTSGTATVIDNATNADGKEFYTIMTPDEHVFYLIIDKQRNVDNVYFLNAVTVDDLMALAENPKPSPGGAFSLPPSEIIPEPPEETLPVTEQEQGGNNMGMYIFIGAIVIVGGGAGYAH